jgi:outer membrane protein assembly factor BamB
VGTRVVRELEPSDPREIGPYRLLGRLGEGGMGRVFLGLSAGGRRVAVKVIHDRLAAEPEFRVRFRREIAAARKVNGLFTAMVVDADVDGPTPWLATAYVDGPSLADAVHEHGPLPAASVRTLAAGLAESLAAIHAAGVIHRDLKPRNVLLAGDGPRVIDFGISLAAGTTSLTEAGFVIGSPGFMSPEQAEGRDVGPASDIFSLGAVLAFAATGEGPFGNGSSNVMLYRVVHTPPNLGQVPGELRPLVQHCLEKDPGSRPTPAEILIDVGPVQPEAGWLPESVTRVHSSDPVLAEAPQDGGTHGIPGAGGRTHAGGGQVETTGTPPLPEGPAAAGPVRPGEDRPTRRRGPRRRLALAGLTVALLAAAAAAGVALAGTGSRTHTPGPASSGRASRRASGRVRRGWTYPTVTSVDGSPAVAGGVVYVGDDNGIMYAIDAATGTLRWKISTPGPGTSIVARPTVTGGTVYIGSENNDVYALDAATGAVRWKANTTGSVDSSAAVVAGVVYVGNDNNELFALDAVTGHVRWTLQTGDNVTSSPAVSAGTVYVGCEDDFVYAVNAATGHVRWQRQTGGQVNSSPAVSGGTVYVGSDDRKVYALDAATGAIEWTRPTAGKVDSSPAISDGTLYIGGGDTVYALDAATGAVEWTRPTGGAVVSSPAVSGGMVYVGSDDGQVYALDAATGHVRWHVQTGGQVNSSPAVSGGMVYVGTDNDAVYALNAATGS